MNLEEIIHQDLNVVNLISTHAEFEFKKHAEKICQPLNILDCFSYVGIGFRTTRSGRVSKRHFSFYPKNMALSFPAKFMYKDSLTNSLYERLGNPDIIFYIPTTLANTETKYSNLVKNPTEHNWKISFHFLSKDYDLDNYVSGLRHAIITNYDEPSKIEL